MIYMIKKGIGRRNEELLTSYQKKKFMLMLGDTFLFCF